MFRLDAFEESSQPEIGVGQNPGSLATALPFATRPPSGVCRPSLTASQTTSLVPPPPVYLFCVLRF